MSLGSLKEDFDKSNTDWLIFCVLTGIDKTICKVVDCVLNPKITSTIQKTQDALLFFYQLVNNYIQQKYKIELEEGIVTYTTSYILNPIRIHSS